MFFSARVNPFRFSMQDSATNVFWHACCFSVVVFFLAKGTLLCIKQRVRNIRVTLSNNGA